MCGAAYQRYIRMPIRSRSPYRFPHLHPAGFTLIELILVLFIMVLLTVMTVPLLSQFVKHSKVQQACAVLSTAFYNARTEAKSSRRMVAVFFGDDVSRLNPAPTPGIIPQKGRVEVWTVRTAGDSDHIGASESPLNNQGDWYPYRDPDRNLTPVGLTLPDGVRVLAGSFLRSTLTGPYYWGLNSFNPTPDGEIKRHEIVYSRTGAMPGWYDGLNSYNSVIVFDEVSGEYAIIWCGEWRTSSKPRVLNYTLSGVYGPSGAYHALNTNADLPKVIDQ